MDTPSNRRPYLRKMRPQGSLWNLILLMEFSWYDCGSFICILKNRTASGKTAPRPRVSRQTHSRRSCVNIWSRMYGTRLKFTQLSVSSAIGCVKKTGLLGNNETEIDHGICRQDDQLLLMLLVDSGIFGILCTCNCSGRVLPKEQWEFISLLSRTTVSECPHLGADTDTQ